jgi:hypothetical protein
MFTYCSNGRQTHSKTQKAEDTAPQTRALGSVQVGVVAGKCLTMFAIEDRLAPEAQSALGSMAG